MDDHKAVHSALYLKVYMLTAPNALWLWHVGFTKAWWCPLMILLNDTMSDFMSILGGFYTEHSQCYLKHHTVHSQYHFASDVCPYYCELSDKDVVLCITWPQVCDIIVRCLHLLSGVRVAGGLLDATQTARVTQTGLVTVEPCVCIPLLHQPNQLINH